VKAALWILGVVGIAAAAWWFFTLTPSQAPVESSTVVEEAGEMGTRSVTVYFGRRDGDGLIGETRTIQARRHRDEEVEAVLEELVLGPRDRNAVPTLPSNTRLRRAWYDDTQRQLYLDFNRALVSAEMAGSATETLTVGAILRTIAVDFPEVAAVQILVEGLEVETLGGHLDLTRPLRPGDWL